ncbi:transmembrane protein 69 isoform X1 [Engystomops pustulosus]|uniref:transmembrane protein 69 isoform X1 n=2 Tax=Engystomops pustulosus TaxID=76066 RepID=UPI003AFAAE15
MGEVMVNPRLHRIDPCALLLWCQWRPGHVMRCWSRRMLRLGGRSWQMALQLCKMVAPVVRQKTHMAPSWRWSRAQALAVVAHPTLRCGSPLLRCTLHTSSTLHKRRKDPQEEEFNEIIQNYRQELRKTPRPAVYLSLAGLVPVVAAPLTMSFGGHYYPEMAFLQLAAANCLLSFYGGIRWGISVPESSSLRPEALNLGLGVMLPFMAWMSLLLSDNISAAAITIIGGLLVGVFGGVGLLPPFPFWLSFLRAACFLVIFCSIMFTLWLSVVYPEKSLKDQSPK